MSRVLIFINTFLHLDNNHAYFANAFRRHRWDVWFGLVNSLTIDRGRVRAKILQVTDTVMPYGPVTGEVGDASIEDFDLAWIMNQPHQRLARDVWQILWNLAQRVAFVNSVEGILFLNNKNNLGIIVPEKHLLESYVGNDFAPLWQVCQGTGGSWIVKPTNQSCGANVFFLESGGPNARALLQAMTGNTDATAETEAMSLTGLQNQYCMLQRFAPAVAKEEKKVVLAGGRVIAQYGRSACAGEHRSLDMHGGSAHTCDLTLEETTLSELIGRRLADHGIHFAGIDMCYPHVLEFNIVNPGGLNEVLNRTGHDASDHGLRNILERVFPSENQGAFEQEAR